MMSLRKTPEVHICQKENRRNIWAPVNLNGNALSVLKVAQQVSRQCGSDTFELFLWAADFWRHQLSASFLTCWNRMRRPPRYTGPNSHSINHAASASDSLQRRSLLSLSLPTRRPVASHETAFSISSKLKRLTHVHCLGLALDGKAGATAWASSPIVSEDQATFSPQWAEVRLLFHSEHNSKGKWLLFLPACSMFLLYFPL